MNPARANILGRIRTALQTDSAPPVAPSASAPFAPVTNPAETFRAEFLAQRGEIITDLPAFLAGFPKVASDVDALPGNAGIHEADLGVTGCECLIAQTGTIVVSTRAISVLPPVHLVIARPDQLVPDLADAFALLRQRYDGRWPAALSFITGPSRTADIEKILVMGAHGPKRLAIYIQ